MEIQVFDAMTSRTREVHRILTELIRAAGVALNKYDTNEDAEDMATALSHAQFQAILALDKLP